MRSELTGAPWDCGRESLPSLGQLLAEKINEYPLSQFVEIDAGEHPRTITVKEQWERAQSLRAELESCEVEQGASLILCFESNVDLIAATWAAIAHRCNIYLWHVQRGNSRSLDFPQRSEYLHNCLGPCWLVTTPAITLKFSAESKSLYSGVISTTFTGIDRQLDWKPNDVETTSFYLQTSGTAGNPKLAALSFQATVERQINLARNRKGGFEVGLTYLPFDNISALVNLLPIYQVSVLVHPECFSADPASLLRIVSRHRVETMVMSSTQAARLVECLERDGSLMDLTSLKALRYGLEPIVPTVIKRLNELLDPWTALPLLTAFGYGMTETGLLSVTQLTTLDTLLGTKRTSPYVSLGGCVSGKALRVVDEHGRVAPQSEIGLIQAKLEMGMIDGFLDERGILQPLDSVDGWISTGDLGFIQDGALSVTGREKEILIVRGRNIPLLGVEEALRKIPGIRSDYLAASAIESDSMVIYFSIDSSSKEAIQRAAREVSREASIYAGVQPECIVHIDPASFPLTNTGKVSRRDLLAGFRSGTFVPVPLERNSSGLPIDDSFDYDLRKLAEIWKDCLNLDGLPGMDMNFYDLGGDSVKAASLLQTLSVSFQTQVDTSWFFENPTVRGSFEALRRSDSGEYEEPPKPFGENSPVVVMRQGSERIPLFLIPGGMGTKNELLVFSDLVRHFESDRNVYGFEAPLGKSRGDKTLSVKQIAGDYITEIKRIQPLGPYVVCGECIAAAVAYEVVQQLIDSGERIAQLILLDPFFPTRKYFSHFRETGYERLKKVHGADLASRVYPYYLALFHYQPSNFEGDTTLMVAETSSGGIGGAKNWQELISGKLQIKHIPGDHDSYIREHALETGQLLGSVIDDITDR